MTLETGLAGPGISVHPPVFIVHICLVVFMATDAGECTIVRIGMAFRTGIPFSPVTACIYRKISIMDRKLRWFPSRICGMAIVAGSRDVGCGMTGIRCLVIIRLVAGNALG